MTGVGARPECPACGADEVIPIAYGLPGPEMQRAAARGEIALGGCSVDEENPNWWCTACREAFS